MFGKNGLKNNMELAGAFVFFSYVEFDKFVINILSRIPVLPTNVFAKVISGRYLLIIFSVKHLFTVAYHLLCNSFPDLECIVYH